MYNFIIFDDFKAIATEEDLDVLSDNNLLIIEQCNRIAIDEALAYLSVKYDVETLFKDPIEFIENDSYKVGDRIYIVESRTDGSYDIIHYTCILDAINQPITNTLYFTQRDARDQKLLEVVMSISLFYIHKRLTPNNIPTFRLEAYDGNGNMDFMSALKWLGLIQKGSLNPYKWPVIANEEEDNTIYTIEGNDPSIGIMFGNSMGQDYFWYNNLHDPNYITNTNSII